MAFLLIKSAYLAHNAQNEGCTAYIYIYLYTESLPSARHRGINIQGGSNGYFVCLVFIFRGIQRGNIQYIIARRRAPYDSPEGRRKGREEGYPAACLNILLKYISQYTTTGSVASATGPSRRHSRMCFGRRCLNSHWGS